MKSKKIIASVMALTLTVGAFALPVSENALDSQLGITASAREWADYSTKVGETTWNYCKNEDGTIRITGYDDYISSNVVIPSHLDGYKVTEIGYEAFEDSDIITSVKIPDTVVTIKKYCFKNCTSLTSVIIPSSVKHIEYSAFEGCSSLKNITIPSSIEKIEKSTFEDCESLTNIDLPDSIVSIDDEAFYNCTSLVEIVMPKNLKTIGDGAFMFCSKLKDVTLNDSLTNVGKYSFTNCYKLKSIKLPKSLKTIHEYAFGYTAEIGVFGIVSNEKTIKDFTVLCMSDSAAEKYAKDNKIKIKYLNGNSTSKVNISKSIISLSENGSVIVKTGTKTLKKNKDYYVSIKDNVTTGKIIITVTGKGDFTGKKVSTISVKPAQQKITKLDKTSNSVTAYYKKSSTANGYEIKISSNREFKGAKTVKVTNGRSNVKTIKNLKSNKKYYVKVRTYRNVNNKNYYGNWSTVKAVRTR